ncbi:MAG: phage tail protein [Rhodobacteraceae bacterium]|nr:phage tail protein [Paracoccaceae bacterium]
MALGSFRFGVNKASYQALSRTAAWRWSTLDRIGRAPASQFLGAGAEDIRLEGVIYPHFKGGLRQVEAMRVIAGLGEPMILVDGLGWVLNRWCITRIEERKRVFLADGAPRKIEFSLDLQSYGEDAPWLSI